jgi:hypothetical protein
MATIKKHFKELVDMVAEFTPDHSIDLTNGGHVRIVLRRRGQSRTVFAPQTPSDHRSMLNVRTKVRHAFQQMAA